MAGWITPLSADLQIIPELWRNLRQALRRAALNSGQCDFWGIRIQPQILADNSFYFAAVKIPLLETAPGIFVTKILPAGNYICLSQKNLTAEMESVLKYLYQPFLPKSGLLLADPLEIEHFLEPKEILIPVQLMPNRSKPR